MVKHVFLKFSEFVTNKKFSFNGSKLIFVRINVNNFIGNINCNRYYVDIFTFANTVDFFNN